MKKLFIFIIALTAIPLFSQKLPDQVQIHYDGTNRYLQNHIDFQYPSNTYFLGWHWFSGKYMTKALGMNTIHDMIQDWTNDLNNPKYKTTGAYSDSCRLIILSSWISHDRPGWNPRNARALHFNPIVKSNEFNDTTFDATNGFIGFQYINPTTSVNGRSLVLDKMTTDTGIVLKNNFLADRFNFDSSIPTIPNDTTGQNDILNDTLLGTYFFVTRPDLNSEDLYFSINLRRIDELDTLTDYTTVLKIRLPYVTTKDTLDSVKTGFVKFASIPSNRLNDTINLNNNRGIIRKDVASNNVTQIDIKRVMLPKGNANDKDITLFGKISFNSADNSSLHSNYYFKGFNDSLLRKSGNLIDLLKIEVEYTKQSSLAVNWLRIETRPAMDMYRGKWDSLIINKIQMDLNGITADSSIFKQRGIKPFRWYLKDEYTLDYWATNRYFYKLIGPVFTSEHGPEYCNLHASYFGTQEGWHAQHGYQAYQSVPYTQYGYKDEGESAKPKYFGLLGGWNNKNAKYVDFNYEMAIDPDRLGIIQSLNPSENIFNILNNCTETEYYNYFANIYLFFVSDLAWYEHNLYNHFYKKISNSFLFREQPWWGQYFQLAGLNYYISGTDTTFITEHFRPKTGEEIRSFIDNLLIMGAKGVMVDGEEINYSTIRMTMPQYYLEDTLHIDTNDIKVNNGYDFLRNDNLGSDYLRDTLYLRDYNGNVRDIGKYYNLDTISTYLGVPRNKVYIGSKSSRMEAKKEYDKINFNSSTLMKLRLQSWLGKGFRKWILNHPNYGSTDILSKYIDINGIKTRPIGRDTVINDITFPLYEQHNYSNLTVDSGFYDITLLKSTDDTTMTKILFVGIQNRHNDPRVYISSTDTAGHLTNKMIRFNTGYTFIPTAEFDEVVNSSDSTFWKTKWWSRLGAREITIPLKDPRGQFQLPNLPFAVKISELRDNNWYSQKPYNDLIDTTIYLAKSSRNLTLKLLPGQGKLLKCTYYYPSMVNNSPAKFSQYDLQVNTTLRYHTVYLKKDTSSLEKHSVWYRRSFPIDRTNPEAEVQWEPEQLVSKYYDFIDSDSNIVCTQGYNTLWCGPPQFVVRYDSTNSKDMVYVVWNGICKYASDSTKGYIFESKFPAEDTTQTIPEVVTKLYDYYTDLYPTNNEFEIGTITINASKSGNYYAWSDARNGICYGWKAPQDAYFARLGTVPALNFTNSNFNCFLHPELNRYSRIDEGEDEAAIVFEGKTSKTLDSASLQVFYTRLKKTLNGLQNYISIIPYPGSPAAPITADLTNKVIWQSANMPQTAIHHLPKIHRNIAKYEMPNTLDTGLTTLQLKMDRIYWSAEDQLNNNNGVILTDGYDLIDSLYRAIWYPKYYIGQMPSVILNSNGWVTDPTFAQGVMKDQIVNGDTLKTYYNDSAMVLSFTADGNRIFNLPHNYWTFMNPIGIDITSSPNLNEFINTGTEPTLPAIPMVKDDSLYSFMRTFYLDDSSNTMESRENFFKTQLFTKKYHSFFGIANKDKKARWFTPIALTDEQGQIQRPKVYTHRQDGNRLIPRDTIITDWFEVGTIKSIDFIEKGNLTEDYSMKIQRQSDGKIYSLQNSEHNDNKFRIRTKMLLNGKNDKYRLVWTINKTNAKFMEQIVIGDIAQRAELDGNLEQRELGKLGDVKAEEFIDLNQETYANKENKLGLSVYPNPANDELYVVCYLPRTQIAELKSELNLKLFDNLGKEVFSKEIKAGQITRIPTDKLQSGNYFVKVFQTDQTTIPAEVRNVIIQK